MARTGRAFPIKAHVLDSGFRDVMFSPPVGRSLIVANPEVQKAATWARFGRQFDIKAHVGNTLQWITLQPSPPVGHAYIVANPEVQKAATWARFGRQFEIHAHVQNTLQWITIQPPPPPPPTTVPAVRLYGKTGTFYNQNGDTELATEQTFDQVAVPSWDFHAGKSAGWSAFTDGHLFMANSDLAGELSPSGTEMVVSVFDTVAETIVHNVIPTSTGKTSVLTPSSTTGGSSVNDMDTVVVSGETWVVGIAGYPYHGWQIGGGPNNGVYPTFLVFRKSGGTWSYDATKSKTADQLHASSASGANAFPNLTNSFGETYAYNHLCAEIAITPASQHVLAIEYFNDKNTTPPMNNGGGLMAIDPGSGTVLANWISPYNSQDSRVHDMGPRGIVTDPTGILGRERFAVVYDCFVGAGVGASISVAQVFNWDSTTNTITPISAPFRTHSSIAYNPGAVFFDSDGNLWVVEQGGVLDAGDTCIYTNFSGTRRPESLAPYDATFANFGAEVDPDIRVPTWSSVLFILSRPLEDTANKVVFWHSARGEIVGIQRSGTGASLTAKRLVEIDLGYKSDIESQIAAGNRGILFPSDGCIDNTGRHVYWPIAELDSATTGALTKPHALDQWMYRGDLDRLFQTPVFVSATSGQFAAFGGTVTPTLPAYEVGDTALVFLNMAGGEAKVLTTPVGWLQEYNDTRIAGGFGSRWAVYSKTMVASEPDPVINWTGGANVVDWIACTWRPFDPTLHLVVSIAGTIEAPSTTVHRPGGITIGSVARMIGFYGADGTQTFSALTGEIARQTDNGSPSSLFTDEETASSGTTTARTVTISSSLQHAGVSVGLGVPQFGQPQSISVPVPRRKRHRDLYWS